MSTGQHHGGGRVMAYLRKLYGGLKLEVKRSQKRRGTGAFRRKFLGYALWVAKGKEGQI